jgi:hypothetical protein
MTQVNLQVNLSAEQRTFAVGIRILKEYAELKKQRTLTYEEMERVKNTKEVLWSTIRRYAVTVIKKRLSSFHNSSLHVPEDAISILLQDCYVIFDELLLKYDYRRSKPTVFFKTRFSQKCTEYINSEILHLKQNDSENYKKIRRIMDKLNECGHKIDDVEAIAVNGIIKVPTFIGENSPLYYAIW